MKYLNGLLGLCLLITLIFYQDCSKKEEPKKEPESDVWDITKEGIPRFVETNFIELDKIFRISKYRSSVGHDYSDAFEHCRSLKHYFEPKADINWATVKIYSPVTGKVTRVEEEWAGTKIEIESSVHPAFRFSIFHILLAAPLNIDDQVTAGDLLGNHIGSETYSDISVIVNDPTKQGQMVSWFAVMTDSLFSQYSAHEINSREAMIISKETRDANPLSCNGDTFVSSDTLENWVVLK